MSGKDGDAKLSTDEGEPTRKKGNSWPLWVGGALTIGFAVLIFILLRARLPEWFPIDLHSLPAGEEPPQLTLSEIGNVLAGIFAPLAFLWLFVATMLQRQELELQREELQETREVLRKTAEANDAQADLMRGSLEIAQKSNEYEYFIQSLYYTAAYWKRINTKIYLPTEGVGFVAFGRDFGNWASLETKSGLDSAFDLLSNLLYHYERGQNMDIFSDGRHSLNMETARDNMLKLFELIQMMNNLFEINNAKENKLINYRYRYLKIDDIIEDLNVFYTISKERLRGDFPAINLP